MDTSGSIAKTSSATPRRQQVSFVTDHAGDLDCPTEILGTAAPRLQVRGRRERGDAANSLVLGRRRQGQRTTKTEAGIEIFRSPRRLDRGSSSGRLATASRRRYRCCHRPRERAGRDDPSRLGRHVLASSGKRPAA